MKQLTRLTKTPTGRAVLAWVAASYLRLIHRSNRWRCEIPEETRAILDGDKPFIACFWHGRMATMRAAWQGRPEGFHMLISGHRDGVLIARAMDRLGFRTLSGSSRRGGASGLKQMLTVLRAGGCVGLTPDGPRGPRMRAKIGAIKAAQLAGVPLVPVSGSATRCRFLGSWDRFCVVQPFGRGEIRFGAPITVPREADDAELERLRLVLERSLNALSAAADQRCGHAPIEPAPAQATSHATQAPQPSPAGSVHHAGA